MEFRKRWPAMYAEYKELCKSGQLEPGGVHVFRAADRIVVNIATQRTFRRGAARIEWVRSAARAVAQLKLDCLALPRIGAGLGGLQWQAMRAVLEEELAPIPRVELWTLEQA